MAKYLTDQIFGRYRVNAAIDNRRRTGLEIRIIEQKAPFVFIPPAMRLPTNFEDSANNISGHWRLLAEY